MNEETKEKLDKIWLDLMIGIWPKKSEDWNLLLTNAELEE